MQITERSQPLQSNFHKILIIYIHVVRHSELNGLKHEVSTAVKYYINFYILGVKKRICVHGFVFLRLYIYRRHPLQSVQKMCLIPSLPLIGKKLLCIQAKCFELAHAHLRNQFKSIHNHNIDLERKKNPSFPLQ